jgi:hypothetical protein
LKELIQTRLAKTPCRKSAYNGNENISGLN